MRAAREHKGCLAFVFAVAAWGILAPAALAQGAYSAAVMELSARPGVPAEEAQAMTDRLTVSLRKAGKFSRLMAMGDVQAALDVASLAQRVDCDNAGCAAEIAGALGVDFLVVGNVARLQAVTLITVKVIRAHSADTVAVSSVDIRDATPERMLAAMDTMARDLVGQGTWAGGVTPSGPAAPTAAPESLHATNASPLLGPLAGLTAGTGLGTAACCLVGACSAGVLAGLWQANVPLTLGLPAMAAFALAMLGGGVGVLATVLGGAGAAVLALVKRPLAWTTGDKVALGVLGATALAAVLTGPSLWVLAVALVTVALVSSASLLGALGLAAYAGLAGVGMLLLSVPLAALAVTLLLVRAN